MTCSRSPDGVHHYPPMTPLMVVQRTGFEAALFGEKIRFHTRCRYCAQIAVVDVHNGGLFHGKADIKELGRR